MKRDGLYYKKFAEVPFTGKTTGDEQGSFRNGKRVGPWVHYYKSGHLLSKNNWKDGKRDGSWVNGQLRWKGDYKNGVKVK